MMKKNLLLLIVICFFLTGCVKKTDTNKFIYEYESLNGKTNEQGKEYRELDIDDDVKIVYKNEYDIVKAVENKETFIVYFGFASCPWCRSVLSTFFDVADDEKIEKIYYVDVSNIRDTLKLNKAGEIETINEGTDGYYKLLEIFDSVLNEYTLIDDKGNDVVTEKKRIYAPNMVSVVNGEVKMMVNGISKYQDDAYENLTKEMIEDTEKQFEDLFDSLNEGNICTKEGC